MEKEVSIIIPTYNRKDLISTCLKSLSSLTYSHYEIIVVDDASEDDTSNLIKSEFKKAKIIINNIRRGPAYCKNQGILRSKGQFIWFLDSDSIIVDNDCLSNMVDILENNREVGCVGGELLNEAGLYLVRVDENNISRKLKFEENTKHNFNMVQVRSLMTCNLFMKKELLLRIGGFDTDYFYISEDTDICERVHTLGYSIILDYRTLVLHQYSTITRKSNYFLLFRNEIRCVLKNHGIVKGLLKEPVRLFRNIFYSVRDKIKNRKNISTSIHIKPLSFKKRQGVLTLFSLGLNIVISFIGAYTWNILFLYKTIYIDRRVNYLKKTTL